MITKSIAKNQQGFSLVELMVVVAIIGVLAAIAVPQVNKYIAKARQSEAKTILSSIYTSEKAFYAEYSAYHSMFGAIGYSPEGRLRYNAGFAAVGNPADNFDGYMNAPAAAPGTSINTVEYCTDMATRGCMVLNGLDGAAPGAPSGVLEKQTFTATANANIYDTMVDVWSITHNKDLQNPTPGVQ